MSPELAALLGRAPDLTVITNRPDLYVISENDGFALALPKAAARTLRGSAAITIDAVAQVDSLLRESCQWLDELLANLQQIVSVRAEDGEDLLERWAERDWSIVFSGKGNDPALATHFPPV
jgi:hypothetical protein